MVCLAATATIHGIYDYYGAKRQILDQLYGIYYVYPPEVLQIIEALFSPTSELFFTASTRII